MLKILKMILCFMDYYNTFQKKRIIIWGHQTNSLSGEPNLTQPHRFHAYFDIISLGITISVVWWCQFTSMKQFTIKMLNKEKKNKLKTGEAPVNRSRLSGFVARHANH